MDYNSLPNFYAALDAKYNVTNNELNSATYTNVDCNFVYSAKYARHRWFNIRKDSLLFWLRKSSMNTN